MPASDHGGFRDRTTRLRLFGVLAIAVGLLFALFGLAHLLLPLLESMVPDGVAPPVDRRSIAVNVALYVLLGLVFVWAGIGSYRLKRWSRSVVLILAWTWLAGGVLVVATTVALFDDLVIAAGADAEVSPEVLVFVKLFVVGLEVAGGVLLPGLFVAVYQDGQLRRTLESHDGLPGWTDSCPLPVLGVSVGLGAAAVSALPTAIYAAAPVFGRIVTGWPAVLSVLGFAGISMHLSRETYRLRPSGWWWTTVYLGLVGLSLVATLERADPADIWGALGVPASQLGALDDGVLRLTASATAVLTVLGLAYMGAIRHYFGREPSNSE
jgi:hypothetical protein